MSTSVPAWHPAGIRSSHRGIAERINKKTVHARPRNDRVVAVKEAFFWDEVRFVSF